MPLLSLVSSADDSDCRTSHPIFVISSPSVEMGGIPKSSGIHNLSRQGWNEDKCRNFLIRQGFIPRNFKYKDGLKLVHPLLQEAFGDENIDLAIGVLEELVEIDSDFPFPGCVYRSWKHDHLKRHEDYQLPHVPHTSTITHSIKPTEALIEWRAQQAYNFSMSGLHQSPRPHRPGSRTNIPNPLSSEVKTSSTASLKPAFRIEYGTFVSVGGRKATILACPTPKQFHQNLWNPAFGRGGRYVGVRDININDAALSKIKAPLQSKRLVLLNILKLRRKVEKCLSVDSISAGAIVQTRAWFIPRNRKVPEGNRLKLAVRPVSLPPGAIISGAFARKNALVGEDEDLPDSLLLALKLPTADDIANQRIEQRFSDARTMIDELGTIGDLSEHSKKLLESYFINLNLETFKALPTPNLFLDSILDYKWDCSLPDGKQREGLIDLTNAGNITLNKSLNFPPEVAISSNESDVSSDSGRSLIIDIYMQDEIFKPRLSSYGQGNTAPQGIRKLSEQESKQLSAQGYIEPGYDETTSTSSGMNGGLQLSSFNQTSDTDLQILEPKTCCPSHKNPKSRMASENELAGGSTCKGTSIQGHRIENKSIMNRKKCAEKTPAQEPKLGQHSLYGFDGASDDFYSVYPNTDNKQTNHHSSIKPDAKNWLIQATINDSMELDLGAGRLPPQSPSKPQPLHIRKQSSEAHMARGQQQLDQDQTYQEHCGNAGYLGRPSSTCNYVPMSNSHQARASRSKTASGLDNSAQSSLSGHKGQNYSGECSIDVASTISSNAQSTMSSRNQGYLPNSTSEIMGDFVPINPFDVVSGPATSDDGKAILHSSNTARKFPKVINPYEFEPSTPGNDNTRPTVTKIFNSQDDLFVSIPKVSHVKNSRSGGHTLHTTRSPSPVLCTSSSTSCGIHRSESSPTVSPLRFEPHCERWPGSELHCFHPGDDRLFSQYHHVPQLLEGRSRSGLQAERVEFASRSPPCLPTKSSTPSSPPRPSRMQQKESFYYESSRNPTRSLTYMLENVFEQDELDIAKSAKSPSPPPVPPKKRARSPMKKMFGENGWLGQSPNEKPEPKFQTKKLFAQSNQNLYSRKKTTMIGKIKNKLEEIAEKADLSPIFKSDYEKYSKLAMLSISLPPPEQARIYMEVELMLVHTANNFLMGQFSQGRIDVDSIKKTVDSWKSKGRPLVIEFMYDQATQRELVIANQNNFRFHGPTAGSEVRIRSMLYNWKQVASLLSIRTFCSADTLITKLLFDTEQVLELLGAAEPLMLRLQQIRATANQNIRSARQNKEVKEAIQIHSHTRQIDLDARNPDGSVRYDPAKEEGYGGMKLVPDSYME